MWSTVFDKSQQLHTSEFKYSTQKKIYESLKNWLGGAMLLRLERKSDNIFCGLPCF